MGRDVEAAEGHAGQREARRQDTVVGQVGPRVVMSIRPGGESSPVVPPPPASQAPSPRIKAAQQATTVTITAPIRQHFHRASSSGHHHAPNLIVNWVNRLERLNALPGSSSSPATAQQEDQQQQQQQVVAGSSSKSLQVPVKGPTATSDQGPPAGAKKHHSIVTIAATGGEGEDEFDEFDEFEGDDEGDQDCSNSDLCFRAAQLATEFLLMLFAATLLVIATIVIFSKKIPAFMESYEIVPKFLFFTCITVAVYSFLCWLVLKVNERCRGGGAAAGGAETKTSLQESAEGTTKTTNKDLQQPDQRAADRRLSLNPNKARRALSSDSQAAAADSAGHKRASLQEPLLANYRHDEEPLETGRAGDEATSKSGSAPGKRTKAAGAKLPQRQVAFDNSAHLFHPEEAELTIDEESDQEMLCASA